MQVKSLLQSVIEIAQGAGDIMLDVGKMSIHTKAKHNFVTETDIAVNDFVIGKLTKLFPEAGMFSEENEERTLNMDGYTWVVDPIDGTSNFIFDMHLSCVAIGLLHKSSPVLGVVFNPFTKEMFHACKGDGAFLNGKPISVDDNKTVSDSLILCETDPYRDRTTLANQHAINRVFQVCVDYRVLGAAALDICYIACGRGSGFFTSNISPWDYTGSTAILLEAGGKATMWEGLPISFTGSTSYVGSNSKIHDELLGYLKER